MKRHAFLMQMVLVGGVLIGSCKRQETSTQEHATQESSATAIEALQSKENGMLEKSPLVVEGGLVREVGDIGECNIVNMTFNVTNTGDRPYPLKDVHSSCSCTVFQNFADDDVLPAGETLALPVVLRGYKLDIGPFVREVIFECDFCPQTEISIRGNLVPCYESSDKYGFDLGTIPSICSKVEHELTIRGVNSFEGTLVLGKLKSDLFSADITQIAPGEYHIRVFNRGTLPLGQQEHALEFEIIEPKVERNIVIPCKFSVGERLDFNATKYNISEFEWNEDGKAVVYVLAGGLEEQNEHLFVEENNKKHTARARSRRYEVAKRKAKGDNSANNWDEIASVITLEYSSDLAQRSITMEPVPNGNKGLLLKITIDQELFDLPRGKSCKVWLTGGVNRLATFTFFRGKKSRPITDEKSVDDENDDEKVESPSANDEDKVDE